MKSKLKKWLSPFLFTIGIGGISDAILFGAYQGKRNALNYSQFCDIIKQICKQCNERRTCI